MHAKSNNCPCWQLDFRILRLKMQPWFVHQAWLGIFFQEHLVTCILLHQCWTWVMGKSVSINICTNTIHQQRRSETEGKKINVEIWMKWMRRGTEVVYTNSLNASFQQICCTQGNSNFHKKLMGKKWIIFSVSCYGWDNVQVSEEK